MNPTFLEYLGERPVRRHTLYSMDDESRRGFFYLVGGNKKKNIYLLAYVGGDKNKKIKIDKIIHNFLWKISFLRKHVPSD